MSPEVIYFHSFSWEPLLNLRNRKKLIGICISTQSIVPLSPKRSSTFSKKKSLSISSSRETQPRLYTIVVKCIPSLSILSTLTFLFKPSFVLLIPSGALLINWPSQIIFVKILQQNLHHIPSCLCTDFRADSYLSSPSTVAVSVLALFMEMSCCTRSSCPLTDPDYSSPRQFTVNLLRCEIFTQENIPWRNIPSMK